MAIRAWSDDLLSGFTTIDEQHKKLFDLVNSFAAENDGISSVHVLSPFIDDLLEYCDTHFKYEEDLMDRYSYPLTSYHSDLHSGMKRSLLVMKNHLEQQTLKNPYQSVMALCSGWLYNHVAWEDLTFSSFHKNRDHTLGSHFVGRKCELLTVGNEFLGTGTIDSVKKNEVSISNSTDTAIPLSLNQMIKVSSVSQQRESQTFLARVFYSTPYVVRLYNATLIQATNKRQHYRVPTKLDAKVRTEDDSFFVTILDISAGGLMIESNHKLNPGDVISVSFEVQNIKFSEYCEVVRILRTSESSSTYGTKFVSVHRADADKINSLVFKIQASARQMYRKSK